MGLLARAALVLAAWAVSWNCVAACSCMPAHPQDQFCRADFVILTRVKKEFVTDKERVYRTVVKRIFKASEKDAVSVASGKMWTALDDGMCGVQLRTNSTYVLGGRFLAGKARIGLCDLFLPWADVSPKQRKGFRLMYRQSCHCKVRMGPPGTDVPEDKCLWETSFLHQDGPDCQAEHAICMRQPGIVGGSGAHCGWTGGARYRQCMEELSRGGDDDDNDGEETEFRGEVIPAPDPLRRGAHGRHLPRSNRMPRTARGKKPRTVRDRAPRRT